MASDFFTIASGDADIGKVVIGVIVAIVWAVGALASAVKKQKGNEGGGRNWEEILKNMETAAKQTAQQSRPTQKMSPPVQQSRPAAQVSPPRMPPARPKPVQQKQKRPVVIRQSIPQTVAPVAPVEVAYNSNTPASADVSFGKMTEVGFELRRDQIAATEIGVAPSRTARAGSIPMLRGMTLKSQFIAMEILQPPLALREPKF